ALGTGPDGQALAGSWRKEIGAKSWRNISEDLVMSPGRHLGYWLVVCSLAVGLAHRDSRAAGPPITWPRIDTNKKGTDGLQPQLAQATLQIGRQVLKPIRIGAPSPAEHRTPGRRVVIDRDAVAGRSERPGQPDWVARSTDKSHLQWLAGDDSAGY